MFPKVRDGEHILLDTTSGRYPLMGDYLPTVLALLGRPGFSLQFFQDGYMLLRRVDLEEAKDAGEALAVHEYLEEGDDPPRRLPRSSPPCDH
jgi:hypothetical protein